MNDVWKRIFERNIKCYEAIQLLYESSILDDEERSVHEHNLLNQIIATFRGEVEE